MKYSRRVFGLGFAGLVAASCGSENANLFHDPPRPGTGGSGGESGAGDTPAGSGPADGGDAEPGGGDSGAHAGARAEAGAAGAGGSGPDAAGAGGQGGEAGSCPSVTVNAEHVRPTVLLLVDASSSMFDDGAVAWTLLYQTLMAPGDGILVEYESRVRFGFMSFRGRSDMPSASETDPACATLNRVDYAFDNFIEIRDEYSFVASEYQSPTATKWETPSAFALRRGTLELAALDRQPLGPKYILFVTDGNPNTCRVLDPQCGQDLSVKAVQDAFELGIRTLPVGIGDIITANSGCSPASMPCGAVHLQDLANAGQGLPVAPPPAGYASLPCVTGGELAAKYAADDQVPGNARYYAGGTREMLRAELGQAMEQIASCSFELDQAVIEPARGRVQVGGTTAAFNGTNGFVLEPNGFQISLRGSACNAVRGGAALKLTFPCDAVQPR